MFTSAEKEAAIRARGAEVIRIDGDYDAAVAECRRQSRAENGWTIISDTSWDGYEDMPRAVMRGYTVLVEEVMPQWRAGPTHVFVQAGVGGLAAAVFGYLWARYEPGPASSSSSPRAPIAGSRAIAPASRRSRAATPTPSWAGSPAARSRRSPGRWSASATDWFMTITEDEVLPARQAARPSARRRSGDRLGTVGLRGLAGLVRACTDQAAFKALHLDKDSRVLVINSEGNLGEGTV